MKKSTPILLCFLIVLEACAQNNSAETFHKLHYCRVPNADDSVLCGKFTVFENRETQKGRTIDLNVIIIPAIHRESAGAPIFHLEGGPGVAATNLLTFYAERSNPYRQHHDIVLVDVRGTGHSNPLYCPSLQIKTTLAEQFEEMYPPEKVKECYELLSRKADLTQYTTTNVVKDLEDLRRWLGYGKINVYGLSYGTRVAQVYMKMFPASIQSCVLWSPIPIDGKMPLYHARFAQDALEKIFDDCKSDPLCNREFPKFKEEFRSLMAKTSKTPFTFVSKNAAGKQEQLVISWHAFETRLRRLMYSPDGIRQIPFIVHNAFLGNLNPFIRLYGRVPDTSNLIAEGFYLCVTCAEDVPHITKKEIGPLTNGTFVGTYRIDQQKRACAYWARGKIPDNFFDPVTANIPTLILSGSYDPVTPTSMAKEIGSHLPLSKLVIIPEMSHMFDGLSNIECFDDLCVKFIDNPTGNNLNIDCISTMKPGDYKVAEHAER